MVFTRLLTHTRKETMPLIEVKLYDRRIKTVAATPGCWWRALSPKQWGIGGKPTDVTQATQATV